MWEKIPHTMYCTQDYGSQQFTEMISNISRNVMFVRGLVNLTEGMRCP
jgi:hypothetical protein